MIRLYKKYQISALMHWHLVCLVNTARPQLDVTHVLYRPYLPLLSCINSSWTMHVFPKECLVTRVGTLPGKPGISRIWRFFFQDLGFLKKTRVVFIGTWKILEFWDGSSPCIIFQIGLFLDIIFGLLNRHIFKVCSNNNNSNTLFSTWDCYITCYKFYMSNRLMVEKSARYLIIVTTNRVKYLSLHVGSVRKILTVCCRRIHQYNTRTADMAEN